MTKYFRYKSIDFELEDIYLRYIFTIWFVITANKIDFEDFVLKFHLAGRIMDDLRDSHCGGILGAGHPLLDIIGTVPKEILTKYCLRPDDCILASKKHDSLCSELIQNYPVKYVPGGSVQNTLQVAQWFYPSQPETSTFLGCIGQDDFAQKLRQKMAQRKVNTLYMVTPDFRTGTCACLITHQGLYRSLVTYLGAALGFHIDHLHRNYERIQRAKIIYVSGFFMGSHPQSSLLLARSTIEYDYKLFGMNLSARHIIKKHSKRILRMMPYIDLLFGNANEYTTLAKVLSWPETDLEKIAQKVAEMEHRKQQRLVILTQGENPIIVACSDPSIPLLQYPVPYLPREQVVDTNGSGDAFVGGFLAYRLANKPLVECLRAGVYAAQEVIKHDGCSFPEENLLKIENIIG